MLFINVIVLIVPMNDTKGVVKNKIILSTSKMEYLECQLSKGGGK